MPKQHTLQPGECVASVAFAHGLLPETVWNAKDNQALREKRDTGYELVPGDVLVIPDPRQAFVSIKTGRRHTFKRRGVPERLRLRLLEEGRPRANVPYVLSINGQERTGTTRADGTLEAWIPPDAPGGELRLAEGEEVFELALGHLRPFGLQEGVRSRLLHLGFLEPGATDEEALRDALGAFQLAMGLDVTGEADEATCAKLRDLHGN